MNDNAILNYPGSKKRLLEFILESTKKHIDKDKYVLDIFSGTGCVSQMYKNNGYKVMANDVEKYSSYISGTLLGNNFDVDFNLLNKYILFNLNKLAEKYCDELKKENCLLKQESMDIISFDSKLKKVWHDDFKEKFNDIDVKSIDDLNKNIDSLPFCLFTLYYSGVYFGLMQSIQIDSIRYAIEKSDRKDILFTALFYAMKECSFSKDGHMAQPLNHEKNLKKLFKVRNKDLLEIFRKKLNELNNSCINGFEGLVYNCSFEDLLENDDIFNEVSFIYADPPYTDMQYSRYFHLLNTICNYEYPQMTYNRGEITTGLYADNRFQSEISSKSKALSKLEKLIIFAAKRNIGLCFSYAYPIDVEKQATDRYTMNINDLIESMKLNFKHVDVMKENYSHCNNRTHESKKVYEYLIIGYNDKNDNKSKIDIFKEEIANISATNRSPLYNTMLYWSQKPYNITDKIIEMFSSDGSTIMDPFMGSGVTLLESLNKKFDRKSIGVDINDIPIFLCKNSLNKIDDSKISILNNLKNKISSLYEMYYTKCNNCNNEKAIIKKIIYDTEPNINIKEIIYTCLCSKKDLHKSASICDTENFIRDRKILTIDDISLIENSRIAVKHGEKISNKFSKRSLQSLDLIKEQINKEEYKDIKNILEYVYISIIHKSKILDVKMSSQWPLWIPKNNCIERNVPLLFMESIDNYIKSYDFIKDNYHLNGFVNDISDLSNNKSLIIKSGIQNIDESIVSSNSIDLIITDPPYLGQVPYSEYMQLYQAFLNNKIDYDNEIVITNAKGRKKDYEDYLHLIDQAFSNISRMLKNDSYMFLYFHDSNLSVWNDLISIFNNNNLIFQTCIHISKSKKTLKKILDPKKTMNGEALLIFKKCEYVSKPEENIDGNHINKIKQICFNLLKNREYISTSELYDNGVLEYIIKNNLLASTSKQFKDLVDMFNLFLDWDVEKGMFKLKNE